MKVQPLIYLRPVERHERELASDPPMPAIGWRTIVLGALIWTALAVVSLGLGALLGWGMWMWRISQP